MDKPTRPSTPRPRKLRMALQLAPDASVMPALEDLLHRVLEASGAMAGLITTWDPEVPTNSIRTSLAGLDQEAAAPLVALLEQAAPGLADGGADVAQGERLEEAARLIGEQVGKGPLHAVVLPVRSNDRYAGLICLLYASDTPSLLKEAPGIYNLIIDHVEVVVESARLLHRLLQERRWLEAVVHHNSDGVVILDRDGLVIGFNGAVEALSQWSLPQAVGKPAFEVFPLKRSDGAQEALALALKGGATHSTQTRPVESLLKTKDGRWIDVEVTSAALQDEKSKPLGWVMTLRDIRARKEMDRLQRIFLSALSHELQTPIAIIKGYSGLMADTSIPLTVEQARSKAAVIHEESERLERMVKQMLEATRIQAGGIKLQLEPVDVATLLRRTVQKMEPLAGNRGRQVRLLPMPRLPLVMGDTDRLQQVLTNFIENALKYSDAGAIEVSALNLGDHVEVAVADSGPGVKADDRARIFGLFERGAQGPGSSVRGAGLGLFICKSIIEAHGGAIGVESREGSTGSRFYFTLPSMLAGEV